DAARVARRVWGGGDAPAPARPRRGRPDPRLGLLVLDGGETAPRPLARGAPLVETNADADRAIALALRHPERLDLTQGLSLEVGKLQILEHDVDELLERDVGLVVVRARLIAGLVLAAALRSCLADDLAACRVAVALPDARGVVAVDEAVLADAADRDLDDPIAVLSDDGLLRDDVGDVLANGLADFEPVPCPVAGGAVAPLGVRGHVRTEDRVAHPGRARPG